MGFIDETIWGVKIDESNIFTAHVLRKDTRDSVTPLVVRFTHTSTEPVGIYAKGNLRGKRIYLSM